MPRHDPITTDPEPEDRPLLRRWLRLMRISTLFSLAIAAIAVAAVIKGDEDAPVHLMIAMALGVGLSVLVGMALMTLIFLSSRMGHDDEAARPPEKEKK
jgi:hypothetical protein